MNYIVSIQKMMAEKGYYNGPADGNWNTACASALRGMVYAGIWPNTSLLNTDRAPWQNETPLPYGYEWKDGFVVGKNAEELASKLRSDIPHSSRSVVYGDAVTKDETPKTKNDFDDLEFSL